MLKLLKRMTDWCDELNCREGQNIPKKNTVSVVRLQCCDYGAPSKQTGHPEGRWYFLFLMGKAKVPSCSCPSAQKHETRVEEAGQECNRGVTGWLEKRGEIRNGSEKQAGQGPVGGFPNTRVCNIQGRYLKCVA